MVKEKSLHKIWWFWLPVFVLLVQSILEISFSSQFLAIMHSEAGPHETLQFIIIFAAFFVAVRTLFQIRIQKQPWLFSWIGLAACCCLYVAGEEISWGQHVMNWATPEFWQQINDQGETNLHNASSWLDQKPRIILEIGVILGGIIIPVFLRYKPEWVPILFLKIYPPLHLCAIASFVVAIKILDIIDENLENVVLLERASEVEELYLFYFVLLYLITMNKRISPLIVKD